ncbi:MAG: nucleotidyltransferase domain-containing protein [Oscillospiraceae bacterium]|nr:nucleotidyltransferase domain-containing protein [Oscillospiraceae bacterium]
MLCKEKVREVADKYALEVKSVLNPQKIILFGSYVNGNPHEWSDIDVAVLVRGIADEERYDMCDILQKIRWKKDDFDDIEPHLLDETYDPSGFVEHVIKTGEVIYSSV